MFRTIGSGLVCLAVSLALGCTGEATRPSAKIEGTVLLDGQPLEVGSVHFTSPQTGETAYANLSPGGKYVVEFPEVDLGQRYQVAITKPVVELEHATDVAPAQPKMPKIPAKYSDRTTSGIVIEVDQGGTLTRDIELSSS